MRQKAIFWVGIALVAEKILQHGLTALFFGVNINGIGKPEAGGLIFLSDPVMAMLNLVLMGFFAWGFWDIWKRRTRGLNLVIILSAFDIAAEFTFHGFVYVTVSVIVAIFLIAFAFALKSSARDLQVYPACCRKRLYAIFGEHFNKITEVIAAIGYFDLMSSRTHQRWI